MKAPYFSAQDLARFEADGFVVVRGMYSADEIGELSGRIAAFAARPPSAGKEMVYFEQSLAEKGKKILSRIEKFVDYDEGLKRFVTDPRMTGRAAELLGDAAILFKEKVNFKMP